MSYKMFMGMIMLFLLFGCGGEVKQLQMRDTGISPSEPSKGMKMVEVPKVLPPIINEPILFL